MGINKDGSDYGYGYGSGYGHGSGDGDEKAAYLEYILQGALNEPLRAAGVVPFFWRSNEKGEPVNGGHGGPRKLDITEEIPGPLKICSQAGLHGTTNPSLWQGQRWWVVGLYPPIQRQGDKAASLKRVILADLGKCPF